MKLKVYTYIYYGILMAALLYTFTFEQYISMPIRIIYLVALFVPVMFKDRSMLPAVLTLFFIPAEASLGYTMMPTQVYHYAVIATVACTIKRRGDSGRQSVPFCIIMLLILASVMDLCTNGAENTTKHLNSDETTLIGILTSGVTPISYALITTIPLLMCINEKCDRLLELFPWMFIVASACASVGLLCNPTTFIQSYEDNVNYDRMSFTGMNYIAMSIAIGSFLAVVKLLNSNGKLWKLLVSSTSILLSLICLLMLGCRGAIVDIAGASVAYIFLSNVKKKYKVITLITVGAICSYLYLNKSFDLIIYRFQNDLGDAAGSNRLSIWENKVTAFIHDPLGWIFGNGFDGMFKMGDENGVEAHNDFIAMLVSYGVVGLVLFLKMLLAPLKKGGNKKLVVCCLIFIGLSCMTLQPFANGIFAFYLFYIYILLLSRQNGEQRGRNSKHEKEAVELSESPHNANESI